MKVRKFSNSQVRRLEGKRILITAGPTWVPIDSVRVLSNIATGETGIVMANEAKRRGAKVTLLLGPVGVCCLDKTIKVVRFKFFGELKNKLFKELRAKRYDILMHTAAVADYRPKKVFKHKINSHLKNLDIKLIPTPKLIDAVKKLNRSLFLVGFKFNPRTSKENLISQARLLIKRTGASLIVANTVDYRNSYNAYIVSKKKVVGVARSKNRLAGILMSQIGEMLCRSLN